MVNVNEQGALALPGCASNGLIGSRAQCDPAAIALLAPGRPPLDYEALVREVERCALTLAAAGFGRGDRIAIALPNGPEAALALLAVADCATCVPLNPAQDEAACTRIFRSARVDAVIVPQLDEHVTVRVAMALRVPILRLAFRVQDPAGTFDLVPASSRPPRTVEPVQPDDLAFLFHTSGTTSSPKTVPVSHRNLALSLRRQSGMVGMSAADRSLCVTPMYLNSWIRRSLYSPLVAGGSVVCTPGFDARAFADWLRQLEPTYYSAGPAVQIELLAELKRSGIVAAPSLRFVWTSATALAAEVQRNLERALGVPVIQAYGMTEVGTIACNPLPPAQRKPGSVGLPVGLEIEVRDEASRALPPGEVGIVWVRGEGVIAAYEDNPEANREAFCDGWFCTSDLGCFDDEGYLFLAGRASEVINRGGIKVSPLEVDAMLERHPGVLRAASFAVPHPTLGEDVAAAVVLRDPPTVTPQALREFALRELADSKVPSWIIVVDALPGMPQGKLRRRELATLLAPLFQPVDTLPRDAREQAVAGIFAEVLGLARVGVHDNFFYLGGDSLRGAQAVLRVNAALGLEVAATRLFAHPTPAEFVAALGGMAGEAGTGNPPPIAARARRSPREGTLSDD